MEHDSECERKQVVTALTKKMTLRGDEVVALTADEIEVGYICACGKYSHLRPLTYMNMSACVGNALKAVQALRKPLEKEEELEVEEEFPEGKRSVKIDQNVIAVDFRNRRRL